MLHSATFCSLLLFASGAIAQTFDWTSLKPTSNLTWTSCYEDFQCTRLQVPLDYSDESKGNIGVAVVKYVSTAPTVDFKGTVLFNPGGPGESGVEALTTGGVGAMIASIIGSQYDIVSFDPRGLGYSTPRIEFFETEASRALWLADTAKYRHVVNPTNDSTLLPRLWANTQLLGQIAEARDSSGILTYAGAENVARDMLRITEAAGQDKLMYWGISWGTVLGATFAALFPDRVERLIIDGVMDMEGYYSTDWRNEIVDSDLTLQAFFDGCHAAGPELCAFHADSPSEIEMKLNALYESVTLSPVPFYSSTSPIYGIVDYAVLKNAVKLAMYSPYNAYSTLAVALADLAAGNGTGIYEFQMDEDALPYECNCNGSNAESSYSNAWEMVYAVTCGDGAAVDGSAADLQTYWDDIENISTMADVLMIQRIGCSGWKIHREGRFIGPVTGNTSFPLLVIGNTADPVTPLAAAKKTASGFPGAVVLTQDSPGHTSFVATSTCLYGHVKAYFQNGTLPDEGVVCPVETALFPSA